MAKVAALTQTSLQVTTSLKKTYNNKTKKDINKCNKDGDGGDDDDDKKTNNIP